MKMPEACMTATSVRGRASCDEAFAHMLPKATSSLILLEAFVVGGQSSVWCLFCCVFHSIYIY